MTILVILYVQLVRFLYKVIVIDANPADVGCRMKETDRAGERVTGNGAHSRQPSSGWLKLCESGLQ